MIRHHICPVSAGATWSTPLVMGEACRTTRVPGVHDARSALSPCGALALVAVALLALAGEGRHVGVPANHQTLQGLVVLDDVPFTHIPWPSNADDTAIAHGELARLIRQPDAVSVEMARFVRILPPALRMAVPSLSCRPVRSALSSYRALGLLVVVLLVRGQWGVQVEVSR
jgi:hypothetical protein